MAEQWPIEGMRIKNGGIRNEIYKPLKTENPPKSWTPGDNLVYSWL